MDIIRIVITDDGRYWIPHLGINTLGMMRPGEGYLVFATEDVEFRYEGEVMRTASLGDDFLLSDNLLNGSATRAYTEVLRLPEVEAAPPATGLPYAVIIHLSEDLRAQNPSIIELYDGDLLVGKGVVLEDCLENHNFSPLTAWQGSPEHQLPGFTAGHAITVKTLGMDGSVLTETTTTEKFGEGAYAEITLDSFSDAVSPAIPSDFVVGSAYPNPFNSTIAIPFSLPSEGDVTFTVFNLLGQRILEYHYRYDAGKHCFVFDTTIAGQDLCDGIYFLQVQYKEQTITQKTILLK